MNSGTDEYHLDMQLLKVPSLVNSHYTGFSNAEFCRRTVHRAASKRQSKLMFQNPTIEAHDDK